MQGNFSPPKILSWQKSDKENNKNSVQIPLKIGHDLCNVKAVLRKINAIILSLWNVLYMTYYLAPLNHRILDHNNQYCIGRIFLFFHITFSRLCDGPSIFLTKPLLWLITELMIGWLALIWYQFFEVACGAQKKGEEVICSKLLVNYRASVVWLWS